MTAADEPFVLGIDIGGTKTAAATMSPSGEIIDYAVTATPALNGPDTVLDTAARLAAELSASAICVGVGVASPGVIDRGTGSVLSATDLLTGWVGTAVREGLSARLQLPVVVDNDVTTAALGEARFGAGRGADSLLFVALGTGVGGGLVLGGSPWHGAFGVAGHLGHLWVPGAEGRRCSCGRDGHLEAVVSGAALLRDARSAGIDTASARELFQSAAGGHREAAEIIARAGVVLGRTLGGLLNTLDVSMVVIGGGMAAAGPTLWDPLERSLRDEVLPPAVPALMRSVLGDRAGVIGAASLALAAFAPSRGASR